MLLGKNLFYRFIAGLLGLGLHIGNPGPRSYGSLVHCRKKAVFPIFGDGQIPFAVDEQDFSMPVLADQNFRDLSDQTKIVRT